MQRCTKCSNTLENDFTFGSVRTTGRKTLAPNPSAAAAWWPSSPGSCICRRPEEDEEQRE